MRHGWAIAVMLIAAPLPARPQIADGASENDIRAEVGKLMAERPDMPMPVNRARIDQLLAAKDYQGLGRELSLARDPDGLHRTLNWERARMYDGAPLVVSFRYLSDLWSYASAVRPEAQDNLKQGAVLYGLYTFAVISLDGVACADESAPANRTHQLIQQFEPLWRYALTLPPNTRGSLIERSMIIERGTASARGRDDVLCSGGNAQIAQGLAAQGKVPLPEGPPSALGKTFLVPDAPDYQPEFKPEAVWRPLQTANRAKLRQTLQRLMRIAPAS